MLSVAKELSDVLVIEEDREVIWHKDLLAERHLLKKTIGHPPGPVAPVKEPPKEPPDPPEDPPPEPPKEPPDPPEDPPKWPPGPESRSDRLPLIELPA